MNSCVNENMTTLGCHDLGQGICTDSNLWNGNGKGTSEWVRYPKDDELGTEGFRNGDGGRNELWTFCGDGCGSPPVGNGDGDGTGY